MKVLNKIRQEVVTNAWKKLVNPKVERGKTAWPKSQADLLRFGIRFDYDGIVTVNGKEFHKYQCQPNAGKIDSSLQKWKKQHGGTHATITSILIKKGGTEQDVDDAITKAFREA